MTQGGGEGSKVRVCQGSHTLHRQDRHTDVCG